MTLILKNKTILISDGRYSEKAQKLVKSRENLAFQLYDENFTDNFGKNISGVFGIEDTISLTQRKLLKKLFPNIKLKITSQVLENLRRTKTDDEINKIKQAQNKVDEILYNFLIENLRENITEKALAFKLEIALQDSGNYGLSFPAIVAFGENSAIPHHEPSNRKLKSGDNILIDLGTTYQRYCSDMTRNFLFQNSTKNSQNFISNNIRIQDYIQKYNLLLDTQNQTLKQYIPNQSTKKIDKISRDLLGEFAKYYIHSLGHGVGLEIHELPNLSKKSKFKLKLNDIVTCEPGIYFPNKFGIRIEDLLVIKKDNPEILSKTSKKLKIFNQVTKTWENVF